MGHLALYGHVNIDWIVQIPEAPQQDGTVELSRREMRYGGTAGNIAANAAHLGCPVKLGAYVGGDFPDAYRAHLERLGVDCTSMVKLDEYGTPTWWGFIDPDHHVYGILDQGPYRDLERLEDLTAPLDGADLVHFSTGRPGYYERIAKAARDRDIDIMLDPGQELRALYDSTQLERMLELSDYFIVNEHEMEQALDKMGYGEPAQLFDHNLKAVIHTAGARGAWLHTEKKATHIPTPLVPKDEIQDTTGAGDAFRGAFHAARHQGHDLETACRWGAAAASLNIRHVGGQTHLPRREDLDRLAKQVAE